MDGNQFDELTRKLARVTNRRSLLRGLAGGAAALVGLRGSEALAGKASKTTICHATSSASNPWVMITVNDNSLLPAHYGHGDFNVTSSVACCRSQDCNQPSNPCRETVCVISSTAKDSAKSTCVERDKANGSACNDGSACTTGDTCQAGVCTGGTAKVCTALDQCHDVGQCDPATGICSNPNKANGTSCNDGNACTTGDTCQAGVCTGGTPKSCPASDQCHLPGTCDPVTGACSNPAKADGAACDDGDACTTGDTCQAGSCVAGTAKTCPKPDQCHNPGTCDSATGECSNPAKDDGAACDDGNACTQTDTCQAGVCTGSNPVVCTPSDQCHDAGVCDHDTGKCSDPIKPNGSACGDGNACTQTDTCQEGICTGSNPVVCAPPGQCQQDGICDHATGLCTYANKQDGTPCDDSNACTRTDTCQAGVCVGSNPVVCTASDQCHVAGTCNPATGVCSNPKAADHTPCNDGNACTQTDICMSGTCLGTNPVTCTALDQCHVAGECNTATGLCSNPAKADGATCNDGNACTQTDTCQAGSCVGGNPVVCTAKDQCHVAGTCDSTTGVCSNPDKTDGSACSDGNACTQTDSCQAGVCTGGNPVTCTASDQCHVAGTCDSSTGICSNPIAPNGTTCDDGNACTTNDTCISGSCVGGPSPCNAANCETCSGGSCIGCAAGTHCDGGTCVPDTKSCTAARDCPGTGKCCCFNSSSGKGTCSDITGCDNGQHLACLPPT